MTTLWWLRRIYRLMWAILVVSVLIVVLLGAWFFGLQPR